MKNTGKSLYCLCWIVVTLTLTCALGSAQPYHSLGMEHVAIVDASLPVYGTALNATTLQNAITAQGSTKKILYLKCAAWTLGTNLTVPATITLWIPFCTTVTINTGITLTLNGPPMVESATWHAGAGKLALMYTPVTVRDLSTGGDGSPATPWTGWDTTLAAWQGETTYVFPPGHYQLASPMVVGANGVQLFGAGKAATILHYAPASGSTAGVISFSNGTSINFRSALNGLSIVTTNTTLQKVGVKLVDVSGFTMSDVQIGTDQAWTGATSIGLWVLGRDNVLIKGNEIYGDRPLQLSGNPNSAVDLDHSMFRDNTLVATAMAQPVVLIDSGITLSKVTFTEQDWVRGSDGLRWLDTATTVASSDLMVNQVRWRQSTNASGYLVRLEHNTGVLGLHLAHLTGAENSNGIRLRNVQLVTIEGLTYLGMLSALDFTATTYPVTMRNVFKGTGTASFGALTRASDSGSSDGRIVPFMVLDR